MERGAFGSCHGAETTGFGRNRAQAVASHEHTTPLVAFLNWHLKNFSVVMQADQRDGRSTYQTKHLLQGGAQPICYVVHIAVLEGGSHGLIFSGHIQPKFCEHVLL